MVVDDALKGPMDRAAKLARPCGPAKRIKLLKAQNLFSIKCVRVAAQRLNLGYAKLSWAQSHRRPGQRSFAWRWNEVRLVDLARKMQVNISAHTTCVPSLAAKRRHALKETRCDRWRAIP